MIENPDSERAKLLNPLFYDCCSLFFSSKDKDDFILEYQDDNTLFIRSTFPVKSPGTKYHVEVTRNGCEFYFSGKDKGLWVEILNEFDDFTDYFQEDHEHGSVIARLLRFKYTETFADLLEAENMLELDEDFNVCFINNLVNYIQNNTYLEN